jgi:hypothetical protein
MTIDIYLLVIESILHIRKQLFDTWIHQFLSFHLHPFHFFLTPDFKPSSTAASGPPPPYEQTITFSKFPASQVDIDIEDEEVTII